MRTRTTAQLAALPMALGLAMLAPAAMSQTLPAAGTTNSGTFALPCCRGTAGEYPWVIRILSYHPGAVVPRRMYSTSCTTGGVRKFFASLTTYTTAGAHVGMVISGDVNASTGAVSNFSSREFPACKDMSGIVADASCSTVAALCRRSSGSTGATRDLVANLPNTATGNSWKDWLTAESYDDQMWLYEWKGTPATPTNASSAFNSYVVSKAINQAGRQGSWEFGHQNLVMSSSHYGVSLKSTTGKDVNGTQHQGDSFIAVTRVATPTSTSIDTTRGWLWACASGHTLTNRPVLSTTGAFGAFCMTDWTGVTNDTKGAIWMRVQGQNAVKIQDVYASLQQGATELRFNGGNTSILPIANGEFLGVIVGSSSPTVAERSKIGLVKMNSAGGRLSTLWIKSSTTHFLSYPQLVSLGNDAAGTPRYLLGWGQMMASGTNQTTSFDSPSPDQTQRLATKYFVQEIDGNGNAKSAVKELTHGWGEQDQMVSLGAKRAGWVYRPDGRIKLSTDGTTVTSMPSPNSPDVIFMTYTSTSM